MVSNQPTSGEGSKNSDQSGSDSFAYSTLKKLTPIAKKNWEEGGSVRRAKELVVALRANAFHYSPLPSSSCIRLLKIKPGDPSSVVRCSLRTVDLDESPKYTALSYSWRSDRSWAPSISNALGNLLKIENTMNWGRFKALLGLERSEEGDTEKVKESEESTKTILCDEKTMKVYPNLYNALLRLRQTHPGEYWIDAVCINQTNMTERSAQVQMMGRIYRSAQLVTIWLGTCPTLLSPSIEQLELSLRPSPAERPPSTDSDQLTQNKSHSLLVSIGIIYLLTRRWFRRLWVLQEMCLAAQIIFLFGENQIHAETLTKIIQFQDHNLISEEKKPDFVLMIDFILPYWGSHIKHIPIMMDSRERFKRGGRRWSLDQWLQICKGRKTTDPRDVLYAGLSLIQPESLWINQDIKLEETASSSPSPSTNRLQKPVTMRKLWPFIHADYNAEAPEVLLNLAACLLSQSSGLNLFTITCRFRDPDTSAKESNAIEDPSLALLPSWIPNIASWTSRILEPLATKPGASFAACTSLPSNPKISFDGRILFLDSIKLDVIENVAPDTSNLETDAHLLPFLNFIKDLPQNHRPTGQPALEVLASVLVSGLWEPQDLTPKKALIGLCHFIESYVRTCVTEIQSDAREGGSGRNLAHYLDYLKLGKSEPSIEERAANIIKCYQSLKITYPDQPWPALGQKRSKKSLQLMLRFEKARRSVVQWRRVFVTKEGYIGLGPDYVQKGDVVMLVRGGNVPYIFTHVDEDLKRQALRIRNMLAERKNKIGERKKTLEDELEDVESRIRENDAWILVGEAYVEGVMDGETAKEKENSVERISIV